MAFEHNDSYYATVCDSIKNFIDELEIDYVENKLGIKPQIKSLNIYADQIDNNKLLSSVSTSEIFPS